MVRQFHRTVAHGTSAGGRCGCGRGGIGCHSRDEGPREVPVRLVERMRKTREERAEALENWADRVEAAGLKTAETKALRTIAQLVDQRDELDQQITEAVISARQSQRSWSEIGTMLGVSKQAAQRKYSPKASNRRA